MMNVIRRGTTPTNVFDVDIDLREATVYFWYSQDEKVLIRKCSADGGIVVNENNIQVVLSQQETLMFSQKSKDQAIEMQAGYVTASGAADRSDVIVTTVGKILEDLVMEYVPDQV